MNTKTSNIQTAKQPTAKDNNLWQSQRLSTQAGQMTGDAIAYAGHLVARGAGGIGNYLVVTKDSAVKGSREYAALRRGLREGTIQPT